jgi:hypothetical protein
LDLPEVPDFPDLPDLPDLQEEDIPLTLIPDFQTEG